MYSEIYIKKDKRGFRYNLNAPWNRLSLNNKYFDYVQTYTDDEFKADVFLRYGKHCYTYKDELDILMDNESKRRFGCLISDIYEDIVLYIGTEESARNILFVNIDPLLGLR